MQPRSWRLAFFAALALETVLLLAPIASPVPGGGGTFRWDLVEHFASFAALGFLASRAFAAGPGESESSRRALLWGALALYALATEVAQRSLPPRQFDLADLAADVVGALAVAFPRRRA